MGLHIQTAGVVIVEQLLESLDQIDPRRVEARESRDAGREHRAEFLGSRALTTAREHVLDRLPVDLAQIHERRFVFTVS